MRLEPLYRIRFTYSDGWGADLAGPENAECQFFFLAEGRCEGRIAGRFIGANHPHRRSDGTFLPDFQGVIETVDGAEVLFDYRGYGRAYPVGRRQMVRGAPPLGEDKVHSGKNDPLRGGCGGAPSKGRGPEVFV